jgi:uncharacterized protein YjcR
MHGAAAGAPTGNRNAFKHGLYSANAILMRLLARVLAEEARKLVKTI